MKINKDSLRDRALKLSKELDIDTDVIYNRFFYDAFLRRLANSRYKDNFVLKGGLYLSSLIGAKNRSTVDIDFYLKNKALEKDFIFNKIKEICSLDMGDDITFRIIGTEDIRKEDAYGGFRIVLLGNLENVRCQFNVDVATGDPIVPSEKNYDYHCLITSESLPIKVYSLESVIAEKLQTILQRGTTNSRSKDFYDLYILLKLNLKDIDEDILRTAFRKTCEYRGFNISKEGSFSLITKIRNNAQTNTNWQHYRNKAKYSVDIDFDEAVSAINVWIEIIFS